MKWQKRFQRALMGIGLLFLVLPAGIVRAAESEEVVREYYDSYRESADMEEIDRDLSQISKEYDFSDSLSTVSIFELLLEGKVEEAVLQAVDGFYQGITAEILQNRVLLVKLIILVIVAAVFHNYSSVLKFSFVGEQGFYITYLMIAVLLMQSFTLVYGIAEETVQYLKEIMECLLPAFYMSIILCSGLTTSQMVNTMFLWMLSLIEKLLLTIVLPGVRIYFLIVVLNQINTKDRFSKLAGLLKQGIQFLLKSVVTGIIGLNVMKSILIPVYDNAKYNVLQKGLSVIPGGASLSGLSTILVGAGVLIKNSIGMTAVIILLVLGSIPLLKMLCFYLVYKVILALIQPISDNRILTGLQGAADSTGILLRAVATSVILSVLSIAIVILTTNVRLYSG
ncbi:MAG: stage III sporulation protein AE [Bacteroidales bacterium]|nr:stage III sporulation protein AE [Clostridium sp.]MCM1202633.1 stage III sporulation protein AE [Bacteroidales bacterium]